MQRLVCQQTQIELDVLRDGKPVEAVSQHVLDVIVLLGTDDQSCCCAQHRLQPVELIVWNSGQHTVTVVNSGNNKTVDKRRPLAFESCVNDPSWHLANPLYIFTFCGVDLSRPFVRTFGPSSFHQTGWTTGQTKGWPYLPVGRSCFTVSQTCM